MTREEDKAVDAFVEAVERDRAIMDGLGLDELLQIQAAERREMQNLDRLRAVGYVLQMIALCAFVGVVAWMGWC